MFHKRGVWNTPICGTFPRCERCAINVNFRYGAGLQLYQDQRPAPGGCLRDGPRVPADAAPQGRRSLANIHRDVGVSGTQGRQGWHQLDVRLVLQLHLVDGRVDWSRDWQMPDTGSWFCTAGDGAKPISGALVGVSNR